MRIIQSFYFILKRLIFNLLLISSVSAFGSLVIVKDKIKVEHNRRSISEKFEIVNNGNKPIVISNVSPSKSRCHASYPKEPLLPGKKSSIKINCSNLSVGYYSNSFIVSYYSNTAQSKTLIVSGHAHREDCGDVDLDRKSGSMEHVAVRNQGSTSFCMYNSIAQLNDSIRYSQGITNYKNVTSAEDLALRYFESIGEYYEPTGLGNTADNAFKLLMEKGYCFSTNVSSVTNAPILGVVSTIFEEAKKVDYQNNEQVVIDHITKLNTFVKYLRVKKKEQFTVKKLRAFIQKDNYIGFIRHFFGEYSCKNKLIAPNSKLKIISDNLYPTNHAVKRLSSDKAYPVLAALSADFFNDEKSEGIYPWQTNHIVLLTGKRLNKKTGRCQIKIRNSWGKKEKYENPRLDVDKENGSFWIDRETLSAHLGQVYSLYKD